MNIKSNLSAFSKLKPICMRLSCVWTDSNLQPDVYVSLEALYKVLSSFSSEELLGCTISDYVFLPLSHLWRGYLNLDDRLKEGLLRCTNELIRIGWGVEMSDALFKQLCMLLTGFIKPMSGLERNLPEDLCLEGLEGLYMLFKCKKECRKCLGNDEKELDDGLIAIIGYTISVLLEIYEKTLWNRLQNKCVDVLQVFLFEVVEDKSVLRRFLPGIMSCVCQLVVNGKVKYSRAIIASVVLSRRLLETCFADDSLEEVVDRVEVKKMDQKMSLDHIRNMLSVDSNVLEVNKDVSKVSDNTLEGRAPIGSEEWLMNTRERVYTVCNILLSLKAHSNRQVRQEILEFSIGVFNTCFKTLCNCIQLLLSTILFLAGDLEESIQNISVKFLFQLEEQKYSEQEFEDVINMLLKEYLDAWPRLNLLSDEDAKRHHLIAMMHIVSFLSKRNLESSFVFDFLIHRISDSLHFATDTKILKKTDLIQPLFYFNIQDLSDSHIYSGLKFPVFRFENIENNLTFFALENLFAIFGKYSTIKFFNSLLYKIKTSTYEPRTNILRWIFLCNLRRMIHDSSFQHDQNIDVNMERIYMNVYTDSLNYISEFSSHMYDEAMNWNVPQDKVVHICLDLEIISLIAKKLGKQFRIEFVDCLYPIVYLLGSRCEAIIQHARICLNNLAVYCEYDSIQDLLIGNVDYLINAINLKLNTFDVFPTGPVVLIILLRLVGPTMVPYLEDVVDSVFAILDNYHGYSNLVSVFFSFLNEVVRINGIVERPKISQVVEDDIHSAGPCLEVMQIVTKIRSLYHTDATEIMGTTFDSLNHSTSSENLSNNMNKVTLKIIQKISNKSQMFLNHQSSNIRNELLKMLSVSIPFLASDERSFLPFVNDIWPLIIGQLNLNEMTSIITSSLNVITLLCVYAKNFMTSRLSKHGIKILCNLLNTSCQQDILGIADKFSRSVSIQNGIFAAFDAAIENVKLPDKCVDKIIESVISFLKKPSKGLEIEALKKTLEKRHPDKLWLSMLPFTNFKANIPVSKDNFLFPDIVL
ncbi:hypothetical protein PNEG_01767 [Pneumocystis murina B123]|uniref:Uncharacterized protein n=1 Tax=Pneumocystis murina (strain B123) TaxID=1069680 RepID=M7NSB5_PNEMU|nr:hypothetical protein PNEG_01767 [Pneumocystis murina B123]EMR10011.1 hypothetical protein PNEG_01767 [Pneumocystis murina B123]